MKQLATVVLLLAVCLTCEGAIVVNGGINFIFFGTSFSDRTITTLNYNFSSLIGTRFFSTTKPTAVFVHGWNTIYTVSPNSDVFIAYINRGGFNVIGVDWSIYAQNTAYANSAGSINDQATFITQVLNQMRTAGFNLSTFHFIGASLGAHMLGRIGFQLITNYAFTPTRITGLDPAGPSFSKTITTWPTSGSTYPVLTRNHASFVDIIHSNAGGFGVNFATGHMDFWVNGGSTQYKCSLNIFSSQFCNSFNDDCLFCSHVRAQKYYTESVTKPVTNQGFIGKKCSGTTYTSTACTGSSASMGFHADQYKANQGNYFVATKTNGVPPYSLT